MFSFILENEWKKSVELTHNENLWQVTNIDGLNSPSANIAKSTLAGFDGARFSSAKLDVRNIVVYFVINGNVEKNKTYLNSIVMPKRAITVYYKNHSKNVFINGYVESFEYNDFSNKVNAQISILCPFPYWSDYCMDTTIICPVINLFEFPISIPEEGIALSEIATDPSKIVMNYGNVECGARILLEASDYVMKPEILNVTTHEMMKLNTKMSPGDSIIIDTVKGSKSIIKYDRLCKEYNLINTLNVESKWINLYPGENKFSYSAQYGKNNLKITVEHNNLYGGV